VSEPSRIRFGDCELDLDGYVLKRDGAPQPVEPQVLDLLAHLARNPGRLVSKDELIAEVWGGRIVSDAALSSRIKSARRAIGDDGERQHLIRTVHGRGFVFVGRIEPDAAPLQAAAPVAEPPRPAARSSPGARVAAVAALAAAVAIGWALVDLRQAPQVAAVPQAPVVLPERKPSVAVLNFANLTGDVAQDRLASALAEDIARLLSWRPWLRVTAPRPAVAGGDALDGAAIGRELGVRYVVDGSLRQDEGSARLAVRLVEAGSGAQVWADIFGQGQANRPNEQSRIAVQVMHVLESTLLTAESRRGLRERPDDPSAEDLAIRGRVLQLRPNTPENNDEARRLFEAALERDASSLDGLIGIAEVELNHVLNGYPPSDDADARLARAEQAIGRAIELQPHSASPQRVRGVLLRARGEADQAIAAFARAIDLDRSAADAHAQIGRAKIDVGLAAEAVEHIEQAIAFRKHVPWNWYFWAGQAAIHAGQDEAAVDFLRKAVEANPRNLNPLPWLAIAYVALGREEEAKWPMGEFRRANPDISISSFDASYRRRHPVVLAQRERILDILRRLGVPE
jgi:DNA-binding winged helix-turn-helix (wHTH) protein/TolB-like protein